MLADPNDPRPYVNLAIILFGRRQFAEAAGLLDRAVALAPQMVIAHSNRGATLAAMGRHDEAIQALTVALKLDPGHVATWNNLGECLNQLDRFEEAIQVLNQALVLRPDHLEAHNNLAMSLQGLGKIDEAIEMFRRTLVLRPDFEPAHKNYGLTLMMDRRFAEGWSEYDWRWSNPAMRPAPRFPRWSGESLGDKALLVWAEQGVGDEILYAGMMADLADRGVPVWWEADPRLIKLLGRCHPGVRLIPRSSPPHPDVTSRQIGAQIPAASLGALLRTDVTSFHTGRKSYVAADPAKIAELRALLAVPGQRLIGVSWGSPEAAHARGKSTALPDWDVILETPGCRFVDLQYGDTSAERSWAAPEMMHVDGLDLRNDLEGVAALIQACDLVITVSNSVAHLAGALGVPVWILVPAGSARFWYWGHDVDQVPWYPSATLIRQQHRAGWGSTLAAVAQRLLTTADFFPDSAPNISTSRQGAECPTLP